ncbi:MAG: hypothetical protein JNK72_24240 [Myxococcales bacterium]|nr:hypothetical protein [Myxococcales bacterium]
MHAVARDFAPLAALALCTLTAFAAVGFPAAPLRPAVAVDHPAPAAPRAPIASARPWRPAAPPARAASASSEPGGADDTAPASEASTAAARAERVDGRDSDDDEADEGEVTFGPWRTFSGRRFFRSSRAPRIVRRVTGREAGPAAFGPSFEAAGGCESFPLMCRGVARWSRGPSRRNVGAVVTHQGPRWSLENSVVTAELRVGPDCWIELSRPGFSRRLTFARPEGATACRAEALTPPWRDATGAAVAVLWEGAARDATVVLSLGDDDDEVALSVGLSDDPEAPALAAAAGPEAQRPSHS